MKRGAPGHVYQPLWQLTRGEREIAHQGMTTSRGGVDEGKEEEGRRERKREGRGRCAHKVALAPRASKSKT